MSKFKIKILLSCLLLLSSSVLSHQPTADAGILKLIMAASVDTRKPVAFLTIITGQSNEQCGDAVSDGSMPASWLTPQSKIWIYNWGATATGVAGSRTAGYVYPGSWQHMEPNVNTMSEPRLDGFAQGAYPGYWGMEQGIAHGIYDSVIAGNVRSRPPPGSIVAVFKVAEGGIGIDHWQPGGDKRALFDTHLVEAITKLRDSGYTVVPVMLEWGQGENNAGEATSTYYPKVEEFFSHVRGLHPVLTNLPIIIRKLGSVQTFFNSGQRATVNDAFDSVAAHDPYCKTLNPDDFPAVVVETGAHIHYTADSKLILGHESFKLRKTLGPIYN